MTVERQVAAQNRQAFRYTSFRFVPDPGLGIHLGVWREGEQFYVWGATRNLPAFCVVLEVVAPGLLVVKHSRGDESEKFVNIAVLQGDEIKMIDEKSASLPDCPDLLTSLLG